MEVDLIKSVPDGVSFHQNNIELKGKKIEQEYEPIFKEGNTNESTISIGSKRKISKKIFE